jgi:hypothetical protein
LNFFSNLNIFKFAKFQKLFLNRKLKREKKKENRKRKKENRKRKKKRKRKKREIGKIA